ncbi:MAG: PQQ-binding-like beta-propeller repeat protein [Cellulomonas sp.]
MGSTRRGMVDVVLVDDVLVDDVLVDGVQAGAAATEAGPAGPDLPQPPRDRRLAWRRRAHRWWPVAAGLALVLLTTTVVADRRERQHLAALAEVPGVLAPLGGTITERWSSDVAQYWLVGTTADLLIGRLDDVDGSNAVVAMAKATGDVAWRVTTRPTGAASYGIQCVVAPSPPTTPAAADPSAADPADVVVCVVVDEVEDVMSGDVVGATYPSKAHLLVLDAADGAVLGNGPTNPTTVVSTAGTDLLIAAVRPDGRYELSRKSAWDVPARWTFTTPDPLGGDEFGHRSAWVTAAGDLVQIESWSMSMGGGARASWVLDADGSALRSPTHTDIAGYLPGYGVLRHGRLLTEPGFEAASFFTTLTDLVTGNSFRMDANPFDALPDDGSLDDLVLAQSSAGDELIAANLSTGLPLWTVPSTGGTTAMVIEGRIIRVETDRLVAIDGRTGKTVWSAPLDAASLAAGNYQALSTSVFTDGRVVLYAGSDPARFLEFTAYALEDGRKLWTSTLPRGYWLYEVDGTLYGRSDQGLVALG